MSNENRFPTGNPDDFARDPDHVPQDLGFDQEAGRRLSQAIAMKMESLIDFARENWKPNVQRWKYEETQTDMNVVIKGEIEHPHVGDGEIVLSHQSVDAPEKFRYKDWQRVGFDSTCKLTIRDYTEPNPDNIAQIRRYIKQKDLSRFAPIMFATEYYFDKQGNSAKISIFPTDCLPNDTRPNIIDAFNNPAPFEGGTDFRGVRADIQPGDFELVTYALDRLEHSLRE